MARIKWTYEMLAAEALKYKTRSEFKEKSKNAYQRSVDKKIIDEICSHMEWKNGVQWTNEMLAAEALKYKTVKDFMVNSKKAYYVIHNRGLSKKFFSHMISAKSVLWDKDSIKKEALKYNSKTDFANGCGSAYSAARKLGILDDVCSHMTDGQFIWDHEDLLKEAKKYSYRSDFQKFSKKAYQVAYKRKVLDQICSHMEKMDGGTDNDAIYIWKAIGHSYNGNQVYKIGVTSARLDEQRIAKVAKKANMEADIVCLAKTTIKAHIVEKMLKEIGVHPGYKGFDGASEFRAMTPEQIEQAICIIANHTEA